MRLSRIIALPVLFLASTTFAQQVNIGGAVVGGVAITTDGLLQYRQTAATKPATPPKGKSDQLYISLPRVLAEWRAAKDAGKAPPADVLYLKGLTQIQNLFVYPDQHDLVLAGPAEPYKADNPAEPLGTLTGRPVVQLEDLIVALRAVLPSTGLRTGPGSIAQGTFFGCSLENPTNFQQAWTATLDKFGKGPRPTLLAEMKKALGPQEVKLYGLPGDCRIALAMLAADYHLKRISMGVETVPNLGNALGNQVAAPRIWFEPAYEPLLVSADQSAYEFRGPRLQVLAGAQAFTPGNINEAQKRFADAFTKQLPAVAAKVDAIADLQNVTDCFLTAALIRHDRLAEKAGLDLAWLHSADAPTCYPTTTIPTPRTAETVVTISADVIAQGGVSLPLSRLTTLDRAPNSTLATTPDRPASTWYLAKSANK